MNCTRRSVLAAGTGAVVAGLGGCLGFGSGEKVPIASAPLPEDPSAYTYARMGTGDAPAVTYVGNWKCPFCAQFSTGTSNRPLLSLGTIVEEYVEPGDLRLEFRALSYGPDGSPFLGADAVRAARAGLAVWALDPDSYWAYHETVMANQPPESEAWATVDRLVGFAGDAGVGPTEELRAALTGGEYEKPVRRTTDAAYDAGVSGTPSLLVDGRVVSPFSPDQARSALDALSQA